MFNSGKRHNFIVLLFLSMLTTRLNGGRESECGWVSVLKSERKILTIERMESIFEGERKNKVKARVEKLKV